MKTAPATSRDELESLVAEYRHLDEEHRRARPGSRVRRHLQARREGVASRFERLLVETVVDEDERASWRRHRHGREAEPPKPEAVRTPLFRGRSDADSTLVIFEGADGSLSAVVDGTLAERLAGADELAGTHPGLTFRLGATSFRETFASPREARDALVEASETGTSPTLAHARALQLDGLIDRNLSLTPRGRRALEARRRRRD